MIQQSLNKSILPRLLISVAAGIVLASFAARLGLYLAHQEFFADITVADLLHSEWRGLRYDIATFSLMVLPPLVLIMLPGAAAVCRGFRSLGYGFLALTIAATVLFGVASTQFFAFFHRHLGVEVKTVFTDFDFILQMALEQNLGALIAVLLGLILAILAGIRLLPKLPVPTYGWVAYVGRMALLVVFGYFTVWGSPGRQWADAHHAFSDDDLRLGQLVLNPAFAAFNNLFFPQSIDAAVRGIEPTEKAASLLPKLPQSSSVGAALLGWPQTKKPNIVLVVLESWTPDFIGAFGSTDSITPNFDAIAAQGRRYHHAYANGPISIYGLQALLTGMPHLPGMPLMGFGGVETLKLNGIATIARQAGYQTLWAQAPRRASFNMDQLARRWGFEEVAGREDYHTPAEWNKTPFGWDWPMYEYALQKFNDLERPFFATLYTAVTHVPYVQVPKAQELRSHNPDGVDGFVNTLSRADWAIGKFWQQAKESPWHANTVYVFVSDHVVPKDMPTKTVRGRYRIPLAIVGAGIEAADDFQMASHIDVLPTVAMLAAGQANAKPAAQRSGVLTSDGAMSYWIAAQNELGHYSNKAVFSVAGTVVSPEQKAAYIQGLKNSYQHYLELR